MKPMIAVTVEGVQRAITAIKLADKDIGGRVRIRIADTGRRIVSEAKARVHKISGELEGTIRDEIVSDGLAVIIKVGYGTLKRKSRSKTGKRRKGVTQLGPVEPGIYAMVVEFGDKNRNAEPYFFPAVDSHLPEHNAGIERDLRGAVSDAEHA